MNTPFKNDPFAIAWMAFQRLYPDKTCTVEYDAEITDDNGERVYGLTTFCDDGSIYVTIDAGQAVCNAVETLAHELAHVAVGADVGHGPEWEKAFDAIYDEYCRIGDELLPDSKAVTVEIIGETVRVKERRDEDADE